MRLFTVETDGKFKEYKSKPFAIDHAEKMLEAWLESNSDGILEDSKLLIIGRQVTTDLGGLIDLLALDKEGNSVVIELKRGLTPRETIAQLLEYASFVEHLNIEELEDLFNSYFNDPNISLADYHRQYFDLGSDEAVAFNKNQRLVIVGQRMAEGIRQTANFLIHRGIRVSCVEFSYFQSEDGHKLISQDIVIGKEQSRLTKVKTGSLPTITKQEFLQSVDAYGNSVFESLLDFASKEHLPIHWGSKGFSMNLDFNGTHVALCFGYPPNSVFHQSIYTAFSGKGSLPSKVNTNFEDIESMKSKAEQTGLFKPAGKDLKWILDREYSKEEVARVFSWLKDLIGVVRARGLKE